MYGPVPVDALPGIFYFATLYYMPNKKLLLLSCCAPCSGGVLARAAALGLDIKVLDENQEEIDLKQDYDDEEGAAEVLTDDEAFSVKNDIGEEDGYAVEDAEAYLDDYNDDAEDDFIASGDDGDFSDDEFSNDSMDF